MTIGSTKTTTNNYINNKEFTKAMSEWKEKVLAKREETGDPKATVPLTEYIGKCFLLLARGYVRKSKFSGYTYSDEMVGEAVLNCVKYAHNFDPTRSAYPNAFAYFTTVLNNSFLQKIGKEKKISSHKFSVIKEEMEKNPRNQFREDWRQPISGAVGATEE